MIPYLHILIRIEDDGSLHALGAFTSKEKENAYRVAAGLKDDQVRLDFHNGPFEDDTEVIYAGHRCWNMKRFQLAGYFKTEGEAWISVTQEGYVSVLKIDTDYASEKALESAALKRYAKLQKRWRLSSYEELIQREGADKARANIMLRFYEDALESFKPKTRRDRRGLYALGASFLIFPIALLYFLSTGPKYGENVDSVQWLPSYASQICYFRTKEVQVYEFKISLADFKKWAQTQQMEVFALTQPERLSRYKAYFPPDPQAFTETNASAAELSSELLSEESIQAWQDDSSIELDQGLVARSTDASNRIALYDPRTQTAYFEHLIHF